LFVRSCSYFVNQHPDQLTTFLQVWLA